MSIYNNRLSNDDPSKYSYGTKITNDKNSYYAKNNDRENSSITNYLLNVDDTNERNRIKSTSKVSNEFPSTKTIETISLSPPQKKKKLSDLMLNTLNLIPFFNESFNENNISAIDNISKINFFKDKIHISSSNATLYSNQPTDMLMLSYNKIKNINFSKNKFINNRCLIGVVNDENKFENILNLYNSKCNGKDSNKNNEFLKNYDNEFKFNDIFKYNNNNEISPIIQKNSYINNEFYSNQESNWEISDKNKSYNNNDTNNSNKKYKKNNINNNNYVNNIINESNKSKNSFQDITVNSNKRKKKKQEEVSFAVSSKSFEYKIRKKGKKKPGGVINIDNNNENNISINNSKKTNINKSFDNYIYSNKRKKTYKITSNIKYNNKSKNDSFNDINVIQTKNNQKSNNQNNNKIGKLKELKSELCYNIQNNISNQKNNININFENKNNYYNY